MPDAQVPAAYDPPTSRVLCPLAAFVIAALLPAAVAGGAAPAGGHPFGIHGPQYSHWLQDGKPHLWRAGEARLAVLVDSGAGWARQDFWWSLVEPRRGEFVWDDFDRAIDAYDRHGVKLLVILCYGSAWGGGDAPQTDEERADFANYVYEMVKRYHDRVAAWEIWNEPNILPFWAPRPDPELYTKMLKLAYAAAKRADPDCVILGGGLAGPDVAFLKGMYAAGAAQHFDVLSYHNYGQFNEIESEWPAVAEMRAVMARYGDSDKPIWHTETGFYTGPVGLSPQEQAGRIVRYSVGLLALGIDRTFQLTLNDWTDDPEYYDKTAYRGLTLKDYGIKPAYRAYQAMCARLADKPFVAALRPAPGVNGYLFDKDDAAVLVLWRPDAKKMQPVRLDLGAKLVLLQSLTGDWERRESASNEHVIELGTAPVYVLRPGPSVLRQQYVQWPNPVRSTIPRDSRAIIDARVTNDRGPACEAMTLTLQSVEPPFIVASADIPTGGTHDIRVPLDAAQLTPGTHEFRWTLAGPLDGMPYAEGYREVVVESPLTVSLAPLTKLRAADPQVTARLAYSGSTATTATVRLLANGQPAAERRNVTLTPRDTTDVPLSLPLAELTSRARLSLEVAAGEIELTRETNKLLLRCPPAPQDATVDGNLAEWSSRSPQVQPAQMTWEYLNADETPPVDDLQVRAWVAHDPRGIWVAVEVHDDHIVPTQSRSVWDWDSLQVALDLAVDGQPDQPFDDDDVEIELGGGGEQTWCYLGACPPGWPYEALNDKLQSAVRADEVRGVMTYELLIPADLVANVAALVTDTVIGFSLLINDNDGAGRAGWQELTPGIGLGKRPAEYAWLWLRGADDE